MHTVHLPDGSTLELPDQWHLQLFCQVSQLMPAQGIVQQLSFSEEAQALLLRCLQPVSTLNPEYTRRLVQLACTAAERQGTCLSEDLLELIVTCQVQR